MSIELSSEWCYIGNYSLKIKRISSENAWLRNSIDFTESGKTITITMKVYNPCNTISLRLNQVDSSNESLVQQYVQIPASTDVQTVSLSLTTISGGSFIRFTVNQESSNVNDYAYLDNIIITAQ